MLSKFSRAIRAVRNQTCISLSQIVYTNSSNLDAAVLKATTHHPEPADHRYVDEILQTISSNKLNAAICANSIAKRIGKTKNWVVALKSLMLVLRIFQDGDPFFPNEVVHARSRGAKILNLTTFKYGPHSNPYDYTTFVRAFAFYLDQCLDCIITGRSRRVNQQPIQEMKPLILLDRISYWQRLLDQAISTKPMGAAKNNRLVQVSLCAIVRESFDLYRDISSGIHLLLNSFFHLPHQSCINAFQYCVKATKQFEQLSSFYDYCKDLGIGKNSEYPRVQQISEELMETLQEFLKDQASFPSQHGSECMSLEDLMYQTECDEPISPSFSLGHYSEAAEEQSNEQEHMYNIHDTSSNHSLSVENSVIIDFGSFDDWLMGDIKSQVLQSSAMVNSTNAGDSLFDNSVQQDHKQEQGIENVANGHSFVNDCLQGNQPHEQDHLNVAKGHSCFDDYQFVGNGHSLFVNYWLGEDRKEHEEPNSSNDSCKDGWELVLAEATPQPAQISQHLAYGIEPSMAIILFEQRPIVPQCTFNPFLEDEADISPYIATTAIDATTAFSVEFSMASTFQAATPTFSVQGTNKMVRPTFQAMPTSVSENPYRTTVAFQGNAYDDPFAPWPTMEVSNNASFNASDDQQNLLLQHELWLQDQNKILNKACVFNL